MAEYIERIELIEEMKRNSLKMFNSYYKGYVEAIKDVADFKKADVQPVKHGRWLPSDSCITAAYGTIHCQICSECGADLMEDSDYDYDFCPVCGARMDLKDGDAE